MVDVTFPIAFGRSDFVKKRKQACTQRRSILDTDGAILVSDQSIRDRDPANVFNEQTVGRQLEEVTVLSLIHI